MNVTIDLKALLGQNRFDEVLGLVRRTFPDKRCEIGLPTVDAFVAGLPEAAQLALCGTKIAAEEVLGTHMTADPEVRGYYEVYAVHTRPEGAGRHCFEAGLSMVQVALPESAPKDIRSPLGMIFAGDHKLYTVEQVRQKYGQKVGYEIEQVELVTPPRYPAHLGSRFAAVSCFLLYDNAGTLRSYVLEAGMATGEAMACYLSPYAKDGISTKSWYEPTPFSDENNIYVGRMTPEYGNDHAIATIEVSVLRPKAIDPHMHVRASFTKLAAAPDPLLPAKLTAEAGLRVAAIADAMGRADTVMKILAPFGRELTWVWRPSE